MDSIKISWNKRSSDEIQHLYNRQYFQQDSTETINIQENKSNKKKVHFNCPTPITKHRTFENTEQNYSEINRMQRLSFEDHDYMLSSSTNIFTTQLPTMNDEPICSARATVITFIIVVLTILIVAIAIGILFGTITTS